jgi:hypothetical protein
MVQEQWSVPASNTRAAADIDLAPLSGQRPTGLTLTPCANRPAADQPVERRPSTALVDAITFGTRMIVR